MKIIVGLGNPGKKYKDTRHNVGFMVVDKLIKQFKNDNLKFKINKKLKAEICEAIIGERRVVLAKPLTFMNNSGKAVRLLITNYKLPIANFYLVHDDLDIPLGKYKIQFAKGPKVHKGVGSVEKALGTKKFWRVRVGIENRRFKEEGEEYVLKEFTKEEKEIINQVILEMLKKIKRRINLF